MLIITSADNKVNLWDITIGQQRLRVQLQAKCEGVAFSPDNNMILIDSADNKTIFIEFADNNKVSLWDTTSRQQLLQVQLHAKVEGVAISSDKKVLYIRSADNKLCLWDIITGQQLLQVQLQAKVDGVGFSPDNKMIYIGSADNNFCLWNIATGQQLLQVQLHAKMNTVGFRPNGILIIQLDDKELRVWDIVTRRELPVPTNHSASLEHIEESMVNKRPLEELSINNLAIEQLKKRRLDK